MPALGVATTPVRARSAENSLWVAARRLGVLSGAEQDVLNHPVCAYVDANKLEAKQLPVPFDPKCKDPTDTSNFDDYPDSAEGSTVACDPRDNKLFEDF